MFICIQAAVLCLSVGFEQLNGGGTCPSRAALWTAGPELLQYVETEIPSLLQSGDLAVHFNRIRTSPRSIRICSSKIINSLLQLCIHRKVWKFDYSLFLFCTFTTRKNNKNCFRNEICFDGLKATHRGFVTELWNPENWAHNDLSAQP